MTAPAAMMVKYVMIWENRSSRRVRRREKAPDARDHGLFDLRALDFGLIHCRMQRGDLALHQNEQPFGKHAESPRLGAKHLQYVARVLGEAVPRMGHEGAAKTLERHREQLCV